MIENDFSCITKASPGVDCHHILTSSESGEMSTWDTDDGACLESRNRVATKIFEGFGGALFKEFIMGREPVSIVYYTRPGICINHPLH